jgi:tetratricopeptide (TPR) repeat protein
MLSCIAALYLVGIAGRVSALTAAGRSPHVTAAIQESPDELYKHREDIPSAKRAADLWAARAASGADFEAAWKLSRACYWLGTAGPVKERKAALQRGEAAGRLAVRIAPNKPEGHFWLAANMGELAQLGSLFTALHYKGMIKDELEAVLKTDRAWQEGSADRALGEWYFKVPRFAGGSNKLAEEHLRAALAYNPQSVSTLYFLAEVVADGGRKAEARQLLQQVLDAPIDHDWTPEDRNFKEKAAALLKQLGK